AELLLGYRKKLANWRHSLAANKSIDLYPQRDERNQIDESKQAKKPTPRPKIRRLPYVFPPKKSSNSRPEKSMMCNEFVSAFGKPCETRHVIVAPGQPFTRWSISQRAIHSFRSEEGSAIRLDECD